MPRRNLAWRFEPRYGVNQSMLDVEAKWVQRELEDHLIFSTSELKELLAKGLVMVSAAEERLRDKLSQLPYRERLAMKRMLARDVFHIAALYETFLQSSQLVQSATGSIEETPEECDSQSEPGPVLAFRESLFE